jgi:hypothetical protein
MGQVDVPGRPRLQRAPGRRRRSTDAAGGRARTAPVRPDARPGCSRATGRAGCARTARAPGSSAGRCPSVGHRELDRPQRVLRPRALAHARPACPQIGRARARRHRLHRRSARGRRVAFDLGQDLLFEDAARDVPVGVELEVAHLAHEQRGFGLERGADHHPHLERPLGAALAAAPTGGRPAGRPRSAGRRRNPAASAGARASVRAGARAAPAPRSARRWCRGPAPVSSSPWRAWKRRTPSFMRSP